VLIQFCFHRIRDLLSACLLSILYATTSLGDCRVLCTTDESVAVPIDPLKGASHQFGLDLFLSGSF
jgi:hypothetical protein